ncbi:hypothetical protein ACX0G9_00580 [Flavitalea flava]
MNKVKMFFVAASLLLVTAGVFAGKARFDTYSLYVSNNATPTTLNSFQLTPATTVALIDLTTSGSTGQATVTNTSGTAFKLYRVVGSTFTPLYATGW